MRDKPSAPDAGHGLLAVQASRDRRVHAARGTPGVRVHDTVGTACA